MSDNRFRFTLLLAIILTGTIPLTASSQSSDMLATESDTLRGSITPQRAWWDVVYYDLHTSVHPQDSTIEGSNSMTYRVTGEPKKLQIDLQQPLVIDEITQNSQPLPYRRVKESNAYFVTVPEQLQRDSLYVMTIRYHGKPKVARNAPWDGGFVWAQDSLGNPWIATANQGLGASVWWPNKDHQSAEPDSMRINITVPDSLINVSNGRLADTTRHTNGTTTWSWFVSNPINNYNVAVNTGNYVNFTDTYEGREGTLDLSYWVLKPNLEKAREQFRQVKPMMQCFEKWFGPYPFYEDSFKLVETPHLGMEHQSAVAYGNRYQNGYLGRDLSGSGWGLKWDFIIIHEAAHEWWGNNVSTKDIADMWVHEGFTSYAESIYTECRFGKEAAAEYTIGLRQNIQNDRPVIGRYGVNEEGSGDMYYKGHNMLHTMRQIIDDDTKWKSILKGIQRDFYHQTVTSAEIERYINERTDYDFTPVFDQYLRHADIPELRYKLVDNTLHYRWESAVSGFDMPVRVLAEEDRYQRIQPEREEWNTVSIAHSDTTSIHVDTNFYIRTRNVKTAENQKK